MILPPRPENHPRPEPPSPARHRLEALDTHPGRNRPEFDRFAPPPWNHRSPQWLEIEDSLPADHLARAIDQAVDQLDLTDLYASYLGVGSKAHRPDLFLKIVLDEIQTGRHSPDQWAQDGRDRRSLQWLGWGILPSRTRCYAVRDRLGPLLETWNRQVLVSAVVQGLTAYGVWARVKGVRWLGVGIAALNAIIQLIFIQAYPFWSLTMFTLDILVIYGLIAYGAKRV